MLRIKSCEVENFCQHAVRKENFQDATAIGFVGPNGSGKSNFAEAIRFALTGTSANAGNKLDNLRAGSTRGSVKLEFEINGLNCVISRSINTAAVKLIIGEGKDARKFGKATVVAEELNKADNINEAVRSIMEEAINSWESGE